MKNHAASVLVICLGVSSPAWSQQTLGLLINDTPQEGYTLFAPVPSTDTTSMMDGGLRGGITYEERK